MSSHRSRRKRRIAAALGLVVTVAAALALAAPALNGTARDGLSAYVVATTRGPLPACLDNTGVNCGPENTVWWYIHVVNANDPKAPVAGGSNRTLLPGAFVVTDVVQDVTIDGVAQPPFTYVAPPAVQFRSFVGRWPSTVTCTGAPGSFTEPCNVVKSPAVLAGENNVILYAGWTHVDDEADGRHLFRFTVRGTLDGEPVSVVATAPAITMTD